MKTRIDIMEGTHTISVYCPPKAVSKMIDRTVNHGLTIIYDKNTLAVETTFVKEGELAADEIDAISDEMEIYLIDN